MFHELGAHSPCRKSFHRSGSPTPGSVLLDEIGELPLETRAMLLRVLEEHTFERLGGTKPDLFGRENHRCYESRLTYGYAKGGVSPGSVFST